MRTKFLIITLILGSISFGVSFLMQSREPRLLSIDPSAAGSSPNSVQVGAPEPGPVPVERRGPVAPETLPAAGTGAPANSNPVQSETRRLLALSAESDPASLQAILTDMSSPESEIRKAALSAVRQFGSRDAIPYLQDLAGHTDDAREKVAILDTVDYLQKPSLTELREVARNQNSTGN